MPNSDRRQRKRQGGRSPHLANGQADRVNTAKGLNQLLIELLTNGKLRARYHLANERVKHLINHHGWQHILIAFMAGNAMGPFLVPVLAELDLLAVLLVSLLTHDQGLSLSRQNHSHHSATMLDESGEEWSRWGFTGLARQMVRLLVRFHRVEDFMLLAGLMPHGKYVLKQLRAHRTLLDIVQELEEAGKLDPSHKEDHGHYVKTFTHDPLPDQDVEHFLSLELEHGVPMLRLLAVLVIADLLDFGECRGRRRYRQILEKHLHEAKPVKGKSLYYVVKRLGIKIDAHEVTAFSTLETSCSLLTANDEEIQRILIQRKRKHRTAHLNGNAWSAYDGLFAVAQEIDEGWRGVLTILAQSPQGVVTHQYARHMTPRKIVLEYVQDPWVCPDRYLRQVYRNYFGAFEVAARVLGLEPIIRPIRCSVPPALRMN